MPSSCALHDIPPDDAPDDESQLEATPPASELSADWYAIPVYVGLLACAGLTLYGFCYFVAPPVANFFAR